jgi:hypothetical protein
LEALWNDFHLDRRLMERMDGPSLKKRKTKQPVPEDIRRNRSLLPLIRVQPRRGIWEDPGQNTHPATLELEGYSQTKSCMNEEGF